MKLHPISRKELWFAQIALFVAIALQVVAWAINPELTYGPHNLIVLIEVVLLVIISLGGGKDRIARSALYRHISLTLLGLISLANVASFFLVVRLLLSESALLSGGELIIAALAIFLTNIIVFALWYWEIDSPGFTGHKWSKRDKDFQFTQQDLPRDFPDWEPSFVDYLYLSITNAINFAPADSRPLTIQAKTLMGAQALVSVFTLALILARSIGLLR